MRYWSVYNLDGSRAGKDFECDKMLYDMSAGTIIATVIHHIPKCRGRSFCVSDEDSERVYIMWNPSDGIYDEYVREEAWTDDWVNELEKLEEEERKELSRKRHSRQCIY